MPQFMGYRVCQSDTIVLIHTARAFWATHATHISYTQCGTALGGADILPCYQNSNIMMMGILIGAGIQSALPTAKWKICINDEPDTLSFNFILTDRNSPELSRQCVSHSNRDVPHPLPGGLSSQQPHVLNCQWWDPYTATTPYSWWSEDIAPHYHLDGMISSRDPPPPVLQHVGVSSQIVGYASS